jgi:fermentation-respiration switch protein FrsA (DUF1100 family)
MDKLDSNRPSEDLPTRVVVPGILARLAHRARRLRLRRFAALVLVPYLVVVLFMMLIENWLIFHPFPYPAGEWHPAGLEFEDAWFPSADGPRLHGWYVHRPGAVAAVLFCHGNAGNVTHRADVMRMLAGRVGVSVLVFDYQGFGRSEGKPSGAGILADARAARAWLAGREKITEPEVVLMGESIGGAVAVDLAAHDGAKALVLESTFDRLPNVAAYHFPWLPVRWLMQTRLDSAALIGRYHGPLFQAHGDADTVVPLEFGRRLFEAANQPKHFLLLPGHDHNDPMPMGYYNALAAFLGHQGAGHGS